MIHDRISVNALCFPGADWSAMTKNWQELGARRISFPSALLPEGSDLSAGSPGVASEIADRGQHVESITHPFLMGEKLDGSGESLARAAARLARAIESAEALQARSIYLVTGGRGSLRWEAAASRFCDAVAPCVEQAARAGVQLLVEPVVALYADIHLATSLRDTARLAQMPGMGICLDIFACWTEAGLRSTIHEVSSILHLVQVSDYVCGDRQVPSRAVPGDGDIPLRDIFRWLHEDGYDGVFDLELLGPRIDAEGHLAAARRTADRVGVLIDSAGTS